MKTAYRSLTSMQLRTRLVNSIESELKLLYFKVL